MTERPTIERLLPQQGPARYLETVLAESEEGVTCAGRIPGDASLARSGRVPGYAAVELAAQAAAVFEGLRRWRRGMPTDSVGGYLVGMTAVTIARPELDAGVVLMVSVRLAGANGPLTRYEARVTLGGETCLAGTISTLAHATSRPPGAS